MPCIKCLIFKPFARRDIIFKVYAGLGGGKGVKPLLIVENRISGSKLVHVYIRFMGDAKWLNSDS